MLTRTPAQGHDYNLKLTKEELLYIHHDGISDWHYTNKMLDLIHREAERLGNAQGAART